MGQDQKKAGRQPVKRRKAGLTQKEQEIYAKIDGKVQKLGKMELTLRQTNVDKGFTKIFYIDNKKIKAIGLNTGLFFYLIQQMDNQNRVYQSMDEIAEFFTTTRQRVSKKLHELVAFELIKLKYPSQIFVNPDLIFRGYRNGEFNEKVAQRYFQLTSD